MDLVALCGENDTNMLMLHSDALTEEFFKLRTGVAGEMLQKFVNYHVKTAAVIPEPVSNKGRFKELIFESNKGKHFGVFDSREAAENWLLGT